MVRCGSCPVCRQRLQSVWDEFTVRSVTDIEVELTNSVKKDFVEKVVFAELVPRHLFTL